MKNWLQRIWHKEPFGAHESEGEVVIEGLRVLVTSNEDGWVAQGLEIDYAAGGTSVQDVLERFATGLACTLDEHFKAFGTVEGMLKHAPEDVWKAFFSAHVTDRVGETSAGDYRESLTQALDELSQIDLLPTHLRPLNFYETEAA